MDRSDAIRVDRRPWHPADPAGPVLDGVSALAGKAYRLVQRTSATTNALLEEIRRLRRSHNHWLV